MQDCILLKKIQAKTKGCKDDSYFEGVVCTNRCQHRETCEVKRISFLVQVQVNEILRMDNKTGKFAGKLEKIRGVPCTSFSLLGRRTDEYIVGTGGL